MSYVHEYFKTKDNDYRLICMKEYLLLCCKTETELQAAIGRFYYSLENMISQQLDQMKKQILQGILEKYKAVSYSTPGDFINYYSFLGGALGDFKVSLSSRS
jgi:hypothetical protein